MPDEPTTALRCANHPDRETMLRCNRCDKPICFQCSVRTPVGYRCRECVSAQQAIYYNAAQFDPLIAAVIALLLGAPAGLLAYGFLRIFGFFSIIAAIFIGPTVGGLIAEAVRRGIGRRRGRYLKYIATGACVVGILLGGLFLVGGAALLSGGLLSVLPALIPALFFRIDVVILAVLAASAIFARLL